jgi:hypothetical protein
MLEDEFNSGNAGVDGDWEVGADSEVREQISSGAKKVGIPPPLKKKRGSRA